MGRGTGLSKGVEVGGGREVLRGLGGGSKSLGTRPCWAGAWDLMCLDISHGQ